MVMEGNGRKGKKRRGKEERGRGRKWSERGGRVEGEGKEEKLKKVEGFYIDPPLNMKY